MAGPLFQSSLKSTTGISPLLGAVALCNLPFLFFEMVAKTFGSAVHGVDARTITVEVNVTQGKHFHMSGLPDKAVKESEHRVESSLKSLGYFMPRNKVVVNLAPADIRKEGSAYDL